MSINPFSKLTVLGFALFLCTGCLSIIRGLDQEISITSEPPGARVRSTDGDSCITPCELTVSRTEDTRLIVRGRGTDCREEVFLRSSWSMTGTLMSLPGLLPGIFFDHLTGAVRHIEPDKPHVDFNCPAPNDEESNA
jgi:hypothetical protein